MKGHTIFDFSMGVVAANVLLWISQAVAQSLPPVSQSSGVDWFLLIGIFLIVGAVVLVIYLKRKDPALATAAGTVVSADATAIGKVISDELAKLRTDVVARIAPAPAAPAAAVPAAPAGKNGVAGTFTFTAAVLGDPAVDLPALIAGVTTQYSAK